MSNWKWEDFGQYVEVVPLHDSQEHYAGDECWCNPKRIDENSERPVISHNAKDRREIWEQLSTGDNTKVDL